jgi:chemotaxis signal transduction protein
MQGLRGARMSAASRITDRAAALRRDFDRSFAVAPMGADAAKLDLLAICLGTRRFALRLSDIAGLFVDKKVIEVPGAIATLVGIAGFRGAIAPVYDLQRMLGLTTRDAPGACARWLVIAAAAPVAFAFDAFDGQLRVTPAAIKADTGQEAQGFTASFVETEGVLRPIIELSEVLNAIKA